MENLPAHSELLEFDAAIKQQQAIALKLLKTIESEAEELDRFSVLSDKSVKLKTLAAASLSCARTWHTLQRMTIEKISEELGKSLKAALDQDLEILANLEDERLEG
jgi:hypothetical protein